MFLRQNTATWDTLAEHETTVCQSVGHSVDWQRGGKLKIRKCTLRHKTNCNADIACFDDMASETQQRRSVFYAGQICMPPEGRSSDRTAGHSDCEGVPRCSQELLRHRYRFRFIIINFELSSLLGCDAVSLGEKFWTFRLHRQIVTKSLFFDCFTTTMKAIGSFWNIGNIT